MITARTLRSSGLLVLLAASLALTGCGGRGNLSMASAIGTPIILAGNFNKVVYTYDDAHNVDVLLIEGPEDNPTQAVHVSMAWAPRAGRTPIDEFATNATVRYAIFTGEAAGVYSGAGFLFANDYPGGDTFRADLRNTTLRLYDRSPNFHDRLGLAKVTGGFTARLDDADTQRTLKRIQQHLREQLGYPAFVQWQAAGDIAAK